ncbi:protein-S-isoprenylcysteine O-methyltransferase isoform X1 [Rhineura floridana]|uniref:protein-S-isoprenylcysteine O-methyltransferase isoform X1 n=1 Tax=Rhineura floridana TaxID=261503 RepID=UPI002AC8124F|nr:protein-S-isoprenylcysteine O-methyltransferase isoform X1 [Rhineura floridana]
MVGRRHHLAGREGKVSRERAGRGWASAARPSIMAGAEGKAGGRRGWRGAEARASLTAFVLGGSVAAVPLLLSAPPPALLSGPGFQGRAALALHVTGVNTALLLAWGRAPGGMYQIAIRACFLGFAFGCGLLLSFGQSSWKHFGWYMCSLSLFHYLEYLVTSVNNPRSLSLDSFLINHSFEYNVAAISSWVEFTVEKIICPEMKQVTWLSSAGLLMVVFGDCLRKAAMLTAGSNFNHIVQNEKSETHTLVTRGVYGWFRHPSYVGWFYWSIGTQVLLCNPICVVGYTLASWRFFRERIEEEEMTLIHFFGEEYLAYKRRVPTGLPFIRGVKAEL